MKMRGLLRYGTVPLCVIASPPPVVAQTVRPPTPPPAPAHTGLPVAPAVPPRIYAPFPPAPPAPPPVRPSKEYHGIGLLGGGVTDKPQASNRWRVRSFSIEARAFPLAMYRAALRVKKAGFSHMQVVKADLRATYGFMVANQSVWLDVVGVHSMTEPLVCENKKRNVALCETSPVDAVIREAGRQLGRGREQAEADLAAL